MTGPRDLDGRALGIGLAVYAGVGVLTLSFGIYGVDRPGLGRAPFVTLLGAALPVGVWWQLRRGRPSSRVIEWFLILVALWVTYLVVAGRLIDRPYGDGGWVTRFLAEGRAYERWLVGSALSSWIYGGFWNFPAVLNHLPQTLRTPQSFSSLLGTFIMAVGSIGILRHWRGQWAAALPCLTPVWILFASGYIEYYPLVAPAWLAALLWLSEQSLGDRGAKALGALMAFAPLVYMGFAGMSAAVFITLLVFRRDLLPAAIAVAIVVAAITITATSGTSVYAFLTRVPGEMNLGETGAMFHRYAGKSAGPASIFFSWRYAGFTSHLQDLGYIAFWEGTWLLAPLAGVAIWSVIRRFRSGGLKLDQTAVLGLLLGIWQTYYFVFMIPRFGPTPDVDLFWLTTVTWMFLIGRQLDAITLRRLPTFFLWSALFGATVVTVAQLAIVGLPFRN